MNIRAYRSESVEAAIRQARLDLGEDAMLLDSRKASPEEQHLGLYEVRFASAGNENVTDLSRSIEEIRRMLYSYTQTCYLPSGDFLTQPELARIYHNLTANDVAPAVAAQLVARLVAPAQGGAGPTELDQRLIEQVQSVIAVSDEIGRPPAKPAIVALVGPAGAGKTTTLAKLALRYGLEQRRAVTLLSLDSQRVAAARQFRTYGEILGVEARIVEEVRDLEAALDTLKNPDLVLLDTPGCGFRDIEQYRELGELLGSRAGVDTQLVLSASTKPKDLERIIERSSAFSPRKLLFTKLDETLTFGPLLNEAIRTGLPLSFLGTGQRIPEDLIPATPSGVAQRIVHGAECG